LRWHKSFASFRDVRTVSANNELPISYNIAAARRFGHSVQRRKQGANFRSTPLGLIPYWAKDPKIACPTINARAETVDKAPSYRQAFINRRCLIPADGFNEWRKTVKPKLPFAIAMKEDHPFTLLVFGRTGKIPALKSG
jgi:putative SOS response-associated peptidase YedK